MRAILILLALLSATSAPVADGAPELDAVLDRMVEAYGGERNLHKLNDAVQEWDVHALRNDTQGSDVRSILIPAWLKVELTYPDKTETRVLNGNSAHVVFSGRSPADASPPQRDAMRLQLMRLYSPLVLRTKHDTLKLTIENNLCGLSLFENGLRVDFLVDMETWRIVKVLGTMTFGGMEMQFLTEYSDFRFRDGVLVPERENKYAGGVNTAVLKLRDVRFNAGLGDQDFAP